MWGWECWSVERQGIYLAFLFCLASAFPQKRGEFYSLPSPFLQPLCRSHGPWRDLSRGQGAAVILHFVSISLTTGDHYSLLPFYSYNMPVRSLWLKGCCWPKVCYWLPWQGVGLSNLSCTGLHGTVKPCSLTSVLEINFDVDQN